MNQGMCACAVHCTLGSYHDRSCCDAAPCDCSCHGEIHLYLDDERATPEGWFRVYTIDQAKFWLGSRRVTYLSVDNDLGDLDPKTEGFNVLNWLEEKVYFDKSFPIPIISVHSANAGRTPAMRQTAAKLEMIRQQQIGGG